MSIHDYLLDDRDYDWPMLLADWSRFVPSEFTLRFANRFGDLFVIVNDGSVWLLDVGAGTFQRIADDRDDFHKRLDEADNANEWLMRPLVDELVANGMKLDHGRCYSYTVPPVLGGDYSVNNTWIAPVREHYGVLASIHDQIKDLPDGTPVRIRDVD